MIDLYRVNLNLLVALDLLLQKKSVTESAKKIFITQAAMSHNLQQLREIFQDDLLVRQKNYMILTPFAISLQAKLHEVLEEVRSLIEHGQRFDPKHSQREFKIAMSDYMSSLLLPPLLQHLEQEAPGIQITVMTAQHLGDSSAFERGDYDLAIGKVFSHDASLQKQLLFKDQGVCIMGSAHPNAKNKSLTMTDYLVSPHIAVMRTDHPDRPKLIDEALAKLNLQRQVKMSLPYMEPIVQLIAGSVHLVATIPQRIAEHYQRQYSFVIKPLPFTLEPMEFYAIWHQRSANDLGHVWLRESILKIITLSACAKCC